MIASSRNARMKWVRALAMVAGNQPTHIKAIHIAWRPLPQSFFASGDKRTESRNGYADPICTRARALPFADRSP